MALIDGTELIINFNNDVLDKSGNGRDGTITGMTYDTATPILGTGTGKFRGDDDYVEIATDAPLLNLPRPGVVAMWVRIPDLTEDDVRLFSLSDAGQAFPNSDDWGIDFRGGVGFHHIQVFVINGTVVKTSAFTPTDSWNDNDKHLLVVKAPASGNMVVKIDDVTQSLSGTTTSQFFADAADADNMKIGAIERNTISATGDKDIDALVVWSRFTSDAEDTEYWNGGAGIELPVLGGGRRRRFEVIRRKYA